MDFYIRLCILCVYSSCIDQNIYNLPKTYLNLEMCSLDNQEILYVKTHVNLGLKVMPLKCFPFRTAK